MSDAPDALVGREQHLRELRRLVDDVAAGRGRLVVLSGEAGAGKTRLAEETSAIASAAGLRTRWATCWSSAAAPLSVWADLLAAIDPAATSSLPAQPASEADPEAARAMWIRELVTHLLGTAGDHPSLLIVDDLHWCDPLSVHAVEALTGPIRSLPLGLLCTFRDDADAPEGRLERFARAGRHLGVPPLTEAELAELAVEVTGRALPAAAVARLQDRTAGNVLFAREVLGGADLEAALEQRASTRAATRATTMFAGRLSDLSEPCLHTLQAASVIGRRFRIDVVCATLGHAEDVVLEAIDEAESAGLVRAGGLGAFEFAHPLIAEACYTASGLPRRVRLHRDVGEAMERLRTRGVTIPAAEIAHQFANAAAAGVATKAVEYAALAGRDSMERLAYEDAARDFTLALRALELGPADDARRAELLLNVADAHAASGNRLAARETYEEVGRLARRHGWHDQLARAALGVGSGPGGFEVPLFDAAQIAMLEEAAATARGSLRAQVLARLSVALGLEVGTTARRAQLCREAIDVARAEGDPLALGYALASWCDVIPGPAHVEDRLGATSEILACASEVRDTGLELLGRRLRVVALLEAGRIEEVDSQISAYAACSERIGQVTYAWYVPLWRGMRALMEGRISAAERFRQEAEATGAAAHSDNALLLTGSQHAMAKCELRAPSESIAFFEDLLERFPGYAIMARPALAYAYAGGGDHDHAGEILSGLDVGDYTVEALGSEFLTTLVMIAYAAWFAEWDAFASDLYNALLPFRHRFAIDGIGCYVLGSVERPLGVLAAQLGDRAAAADHFEVALDHHRTARAPLLVAATLRDAGLALGDAAPLADARARFSSLGLAGAAEACGGPGESSQGIGPNVFQRDGELWLVGFNGRTAHLRDTKGMGDIARLLAQPGREVHALDLVDVGQTVATGSTGDVIDETARNRYRSRLTEIEVDLAEADQHADIARSEQLHRERDALVAELTSAYGLGGRARRRGDSTERARSAVTQRIRDAVARIERVDADLGHHLRRAVKTGTYCAYAPDQPTDWNL